MDPTTAPEQPCLKTIYQQLESINKRLDQCLSSVCYTPFLFPTQKPEPHKAAA